VDLERRRIEVVDVRYDAGKFGAGYKNRPKTDASIRAVPMVGPVAAAIARRLVGCPPDGIVFCGPGGSHGIPRGTRSRLSVGNYRRVYQRTATRAAIEGLELHGPHDLRHTYATWLEDGDIPARVIDELMGHVAGRRGEREGSLIGTRYRHMTAEMQAPNGSQADSHGVAAGGDRRWTRTMASVGIRKRVSARTGRVTYQVWWLLDDGSQGAETVGSKDEARDLVAQKRLGVTRGAWQGLQRGRLPFSWWAE
jgi:Phage integrase family